MSGKIRTFASKFKNIITMKFIVVRKYLNGDGQWKISHVQTRDFYAKLTDDEIRKKAADMSNDRCRFDIVDVTDELAELFRFTLGEKEYESLPTLRSLGEQIESVSSQLKEMSRELDDMVDETESVVSKFNELMEKEDEN